MPSHPTGAAGASSSPAGPTGPTGPAESADQHDRLQRLQEAVELDQAVIARLEAEGKTVTYSRENVSVGDWVEHHGMWLPVQRVNPKSVTVPSLLGSWTNTLAKITGLRPAGG